MIPMRHVTLVTAVLASLQAAALSPAAASDRHSWCMVVQDWGDGWACGYDTFAQCLAEARAGNTGYCAANPYYQPPAPAKPSPRQRKSR
jgi:ABC-type sugar transport system substrate-binding protein